MSAPVFRLPTRDARDADHLALLAIGAGIAGLCLSPNIAPELRPWWLAAGATNTLAGVLIWLRLPHAQWLAVIAQILLTVVVFLRNYDDGLSARDYLLLAAVAMIAVWYARIDYRVKFDDSA